MGQTHTAPYRSRTREVRLNYEGFEGPGQVRAYSPPRGEFFLSSLIFFFALFLVFFFGCQELFQGAVHFL